MKNLWRALFVIGSVLLIWFIWKYSGGFDISQFTMSLRDTVEGSAYYVAEMIKPVLSLAVK